MKQALKALLSVMALLYGGTAAADAPKIGVVVMHGKWGSPTGAAAPFAEFLQKAGYPVLSPEMPWSGKRMYDAGDDAAMAEIGAAVKALRDQGVSKVCVAGHSMGAAGAIRYAAQFGMDCLIVLAPGHFPESAFYRNLTGADVSRAKEMVDKGQGQITAEFGDYNTGNRTKGISMPAKVYLDYFDPDGPFNMQGNASRIKSSTPVLWVVGAGEGAGVKRSGDTAYNAIPDTVRKIHRQVGGGHVETPKNASELVVEWLKSITG